MQNPPAMPPPPPAMPQPMGFTTQVRYGGFWIRVVGYIIDAIILGIIGALVAIILGVNLSDPNLTQNGRYQGAQLFDLVVSFVYFAGLWTVIGGSLASASWACESSTPTAARQSVSARLPCAGSASSSPSRCASSA